MGRRYLHGIGGALNPAGPHNRLCCHCHGYRLAALEVANVLHAVWAMPARSFVFLWTAGLLFGPFVLPHAWQNEIRSVSNPEGREFHNVFLEYRVTTGGPMFRET